MLLADRPGIFRQSFFAQKPCYCAEQERLRALEARTTDFVQPGDMQPERDLPFDGLNSRTGIHPDRKWRNAFESGWFSFSMKVSPKKTMELICAYWGNTSRNRAFDITADDVAVATQRLEAPAAGRFLDIAYPIPSKLTQGKENVCVRFQARPGTMAGGVFGIRMVVAEGPQHSVQRRPILGVHGEVAQITLSARNRV